MSKKDKTDLLFIYIAALFAGLFAWYCWKEWTKPIQRDSIACPTGQFDSGDVCRSEPTGCPYAEQVPVDSPKCSSPPAKNHFVEANGMVGK